MSLAQIAAKRRSEAADALQRHGLPRDLSLLVARRLPYKIATWLTAELELILRRREGKGQRS